MMRYTTGYYQQQREAIARIIESGGKATYIDLAIYSYLSAEAAYQTTTQKGLVVNRGQLFTTRAELAKALHLKDNAVRDSLKRLEDLGVISIVAQNCIKQRDQGKGPRGGTLITVENYGFSEGDKISRDQDKGPRERDKGPRKGPTKGPGEAPGSETPESVEAQGLSYFEKVFFSDEGTKKGTNEGTKPLSDDKLINQKKRKRQLIDKGGYGGKKRYGTHSNIELTWEELNRFLDVYTPESLDLISEKYYDMGKTRPASFKYCCEFMAHQTGINQYMWDFDNHYFDLLPPDMTYQHKRLEALMQYDDLDDEDEDLEAIAAREAVEKEKAAQRAEEQRQEYEAWKQRIEQDRIRREAEQSEPIKQPSQPEAPPQLPPDETSFQVELDAINPGEGYTTQELQEAGRAVKVEYLKGVRGSLRRLVLNELVKLK